MDSLTNAYNSFFGNDDELFHIFSPYRVCPVGAHVDHQHGLVTGFALDMGIDILFSVTENGNVEMCSLSFEGLITFNVTRQPEPRFSNWGDYLRGAVWAMQSDFHLKKGIRGIVKGSMPIGGVSSSAALLCGIVMAIAKANGIKLTPMEVVGYASKAERGYVGLQNGILDQACVMLCEKNKLLYMDTETSEYKILSFGKGSDGERPKIKIGVFFSGVTRKLTDTDYNLRVAECKTAAWITQAYEGLPLKDFKETRLRDVDERLFMQHRNMMPLRFAKRADHFYTECDRVRKAVAAWTEGNIKEFGRCMSDSCQSSIDNYECGSKELIELYNLLLNANGVYGTRFSGAGFKGACIAIVDQERESQIKEQVTNAYLQKYPQYKDSFRAFFCETCKGASFQ